MKWRLYKVIGIYGIYNRKTNKLYICQSIDVMKRKRSHESMLRRCCHISEGLQDDYFDTEEGVGAITSAIKELERFGYIKKIIEH